MSPDDFRLKRLVETILIRNYVNTQKVNVDVISGSVYLDGEFHVMDERASSAKDEAGDSGEAHYAMRRVLLSIEQELRAMRELSGIYFNFTNWNKTATGWIPQKAR